MEKQKRHRRFFTESFKKETVYRLKTKQASMNEISEQYHIPRPLLKTWVKAYPAIGTIPSAVVQQQPVMDFGSQIDALLQRVVSQRLEAMLNKNTSSLQSAGGPA